MDTPNTTTQMVEACGPITCAIYSRSATRLARSVSIEDQEQHCREFAKKNSLSISDEHIYRDIGKGGMSFGKRTQLEALKTAAKQVPPPFNCILCDDIARLSRKTEDVCDFVNLMSYHGVSVCFVSEQLDSSSDSFKLMLAMHCMFEEASRERLRSNARRGKLAHRVGSGSYDRAPYGYLLEAGKEHDSPDSGPSITVHGSKLHLREEEASVIRRIFTLYGSGETLDGICKILNIEKVPYPGDVRSSGLGCAWEPQAIRQVFRHEARLGINVTRKRNN